MSSPRVLLLGGHGKVSQLLTPLLLQKGWSVTSLIRKPEQENDILSLASKLPDTGTKPGTLDVLVDSLEAIQTEKDAKRVLAKVRPEIVIWSAGAGGKGGPEMTKKIDEISAKAFASAAVADQGSGVRKFLMVSHSASRRGYPSWWNEQDRKDKDKAFESLKAYADAKLEADEHLEACTHERMSVDPGFQTISLRPGLLTEDKGTGKVTLGKTKGRGKVSREDVAATAAALLERDDTRGWFDLLEGDVPIKEAIGNLVKNGHDGFDGEDLEEIWARDTSM